MLSLPALPNKKVVTILGSVTILFLLAQFFIFQSWNPTSFSWSKLHSSLSTINPPIPPSPAASTSSELLSSLPPVPESLFPNPPGSGKQADGQSLPSTCSCPSEASQKPKPKPVIKPSAKDDDIWRFDSFVPEKHAKDHSLTLEQCYISFPGLFEELEHRLQTLQHTDLIRWNNIDQAAAHQNTIRLMINDAQLYIITDKSLPEYRQRATSILSLIHRAIMTSRETIPNIEFVLNVADQPTAEHQWALTRELTGKFESTWVIPDQTFFATSNPSHGEYWTVRKQIARFEPKWQDKTPQLAWRGILGDNPTKAALIQAATGTKWGNVSDVTAIVDKTHDGMLPIWDLCKFQYVVFTEDITYGEKYRALHNCQSVIIMPKLRWVEYYGGLLIWEGSEQNIVLVERDFSDLKAKMDELLASPDHAMRIAENNAKVFRDRYLTPAAATCYIRKAINNWRSISGIEPDLFKEEMVKGADGGDDQKIISLRGQPFETWLLDPVLTK